MGSESSPPGVELVRCPGCGRQVVGTIARCTHCRMELGLASLPPAARASPTAETERCALCGLAYDAARHDACPHCSERLGKRRRDALEAHRRTRRAGELLVWIGAALALTAIGALAHWGASRVAPIFGAGRSLWLGSAAGGVAMGLLAGWRLRERESTVESLIAVVALAVTTTVWLRAALVWANGFNLSGDQVPLRCEVRVREASRSVLSCEHGVVDAVEDHRAPDDDARRVSLSVRRGRLGYWVVGSAGPRSLGEDEGAGPVGDAPDGSRGE